MGKAWTALAVVGLLTLTGCTSDDPLAQQYREGSEKNYIAGDGTITEITPESRGEPITFSGTTEHGEQVSSKEYLGDVLVVNFWYAGCAPCRAEAGDLEQVYQENMSSGVDFLGVNVRDQAATAISFNEKFGVTYPSIIDQDGAAQLAFASEVPPNAVPTTIVLDHEGRVAARILGQLTNASILSTIVRDVAAEKSAP